MTIEKFPTRESAEQAELVAIRNEKPMHNIAGTIPSKRAATQRTSGPNPGQHGSSLYSRRTLNATRRILIEQAMGGSPEACEAILRLFADYGCYLDAKIGGDPSAVTIAGTARAPAVSTVVLDLRAELIRATARRHDLMLRLAAAQRLATKDNDDAA